MDENPNRMMLLYSLPNQLRFKTEYTSSSSSQIQPTSPLPLCSCLCCLNRHLGLNFGFGGGLLLTRQNDNSLLETSKRESNGFFGWVQLRERWVWCSRNQSIQCNPITGFSGGGFQHRSIVFLFGLLTSLATFAIVLVVRWYF